LRSHGDWKISDGIHKAAYARFLVASAKVSAALGDRHEGPAFNGLLKVTILAPGALVFFKEKAT
jgi:hypothetical protein